MSQVIRIEKRKRGIFGSVMWWLFLIFNAIMAMMIVVAIGSASQIVSKMGDAAEQAGAAIGGTLAVGMILSIWPTGSAIFGLIVALSRGKKVTIEKTIQG